MSEAMDEMADGFGGARSHWRTLQGAMFGLGRGTLAERAEQLDLAFAEEGITTILPGAQSVNWRCDPIPLPLSAREFSSLQSGLAQRAELLEMILADLYGPQTLLADGVIPTDLVFGNSAFLRACRATDKSQSHRRLFFYAADMLRGPDGAWRVLSDRAGQGNGIAYALENRRVLSRVIPELFGAQRIHQYRPYLDLCGDALQGLTSADRDGVALLTGGHSDPLWFEHVMLARELSIGLVEGGDLTIRGGAVCLKTMRGLQRIGVLLRQMSGSLVDPLELAGGGSGPPGLLDAVRDGAVRLVNDPGSALAEAPGLAAFLPTLARRLLGEDLMLPSQATVWLGEGAVVRTVLRDLEGWIIRPATDGQAHPVLPTMLSAQQRQSLADKMAARPSLYAASVAPVPSVAPCLGPNGLEPKPIALRMFMAFDGARWHAMPGGLARVLSEEDALSGHLPLNAVSKDVWVLAEDGEEIHGHLGLATPKLAIRRTTGDLPSRVADHFFWLGRYLERLEESARLQRMVIGRILRPSPTPREMEEIRILAACLGSARMLPPEEARFLSGALMASAIMRAFRARGAMRSLLGLVGRQVDQLRDRLTGEMYAVLTRSLRDLTEAMRELPPDNDPRVLEQASHLTTDVLEFAAAVAGLAAENMVRGGGRLFLDFGRRIQRAQAVTTELAHVLDLPREGPGDTPQTGRIEAGLRLALELRDSVITYRSRYLAVMQPGPALDLLLADGGNPRGLAFQLIAARDLLREIAEDGGALLAALDPPLREADAIVHDVMDAPDQVQAAARLPERLRALGNAIEDVADRVSRRYFTLLPVARSLGVESEAPILRGAA